MCLDPVTAAAMATTAAGGVMQAFGQGQAGRAAQGQAEYQAGVSRNNAMVAAAQARDAQERGDQDEARYARQVAEYQGRQQAAFAANGIVAGDGSALRAIEETGMLAHLDAENIRRSTERERLGFVNQQNQFLHEAEVLKAQGQNARRAGQIAGLTTGLQTAANVGLVGAGGMTPAQPKQYLRINPRAAAYFKRRPLGTF
jgi:hypothetical protein